MNVIAQLEFKLTYFEVTQSSTLAMGTPPISITLEYLKTYNCKLFVLRIITLKLLLFMNFYY